MRLWVFEGRACHFGFAVALLAALLGGCATFPPAAPREFRAAWVATVNNIDWPSRAGLSTAEQQAEAIGILEYARTLKLNAIILQIRPSADAFYPSTLEPWSEYLTGEQGRPPLPFYDPLAFWIDEAHRRGLELHAWLNPYRARQAGAKSPLAASHVARTHPEIVKPYGDLLWLDPGEPMAMRRTLEVIGEVVRNYDVDGIHVDDYFYPYPIPLPQAKRTVALDPPNGAKAVEIPDLDFPDEPTWQRYLAAGGTRSRSDWRRGHVDELVEEIGRTVHRLKPGVRFGVSPFGIGRPEWRPRGIVGFSQYDKLYADVERWWKLGWVDYLAPQLYWPIDRKPQAFDVLLKYWARRNPTGRHLWPGLYTSRIDTSAKSWEPAEIVRQIELLRHRKSATGHIHFSMSPLLQNRRGIGEQLANELYREAALVPATPWLDRTLPSAPTLERTPKTESSDRIVILPGPGKTPMRYALWTRRNDRWSFSVLPASEPHIELSADPINGPAETIVVSAVDAVGNESPRVKLQLSTRPRKK